MQRNRKVLIFDTLVAARLLMDGLMNGLLISAVVTVQGVQLTEDQIELPDEPVTSPKQITVYITVCSPCLNHITEHTF